jgi:hypothetical protein
MLPTTKSEVKKPDYGRYSKKGILSSSEIEGNPDYPINHYADRDEVVSDITGKVIQTDKTYNQYGSDAIKKYIESNPNVRYSNVDYNTFENQPANDDGTYTSSKGNKFDWEDFKVLHKNWTQKDYEIFDKFKGKISGGNARLKVTTTRLIQHTIN